MFRNLITARYPQINPPFANKRWDICCREEDESDRLVFDEGDVEAGFAPELDVGAGEEVERCLLETALWRLGWF